MLTTPLLMASVVDAIGTASPMWGWLLVGGWVLFQLYWPFWETKIQRFHNDLTGRLDRIEVTQIAISEEVEGLDTESVKDVHGRSGLTTGDLKTEAQRHDHYSHDESGDAD